MNNWTTEDIIDKLIRDYCTHWHNYHHYQQNDNEVDANWESATLDYIFQLLQDVTEEGPTQVADRIDFVLEECFIFDPQDKLENLKQLLPVGTKVCVVKDIPYSDYDSFVSTEGEEIAKDLLSEDGIFCLDISTGDVYIPRGTYMTYKGIDKSGWPTFEIRGEEFDFAGTPFVLKKVE